MDPHKTHTIDHRGPVVFADLGDAMEAVYSLAPEGGRVVITEVRVRAKPGQALPPGGLTARHLRRVRPGLALQLYREDVSRAIARGSTARHLTAFGAAFEALGEGDRFRAWVADEAAYWRPWADAVARLSQRPEGESRILRLARTAAMYVVACDEPGGAPNELVAARQERSVRQVRDDLYAARHAGILTETLRGRPGGQLTSIGASILSDVVGGRDAVRGPSRS